MKIIQPGDPRKIRKTKTFICRVCGCKFEADEGEYKNVDLDTDSETEYVPNSLFRFIEIDLDLYMKLGGKVTKCQCDCPDCGGELTGDEVFPQRECES